MDHEKNGIYACGYKTNAYFCCIEKYACADRYIVWKEIEEIKNRNRN
jgi:hypothetical protein